MRLSRIQHAYWLLVLLLLLGLIFLVVLALSRLCVLLRLPRKVASNTRITTATTIIGSDKPALNMSGSSLRPKRLCQRYAYVQSDAFHYA
jgi:hypothetical protein